jgi:cob(I)alamin adenosyltransferase
VLFGLAAVRDGGTATLFNGRRSAKASDFFETLGDLDELNAHVGLAREHSLSLVCTNGMAGILGEIQSRLLDLGAHVATPRSTSSEAHLQRTRFDGAESVARLERAIDALDARLPALTTFILPSGGLCSAHLHVARTVCRRAERHLQPIVDRQDADPSSLAYLNRLSDFFFVAARTAADFEHRPELLWKPPPPKPKCS